MGRVAISATQTQIPAVLELDYGFDLGNVASTTRLALAFPPLPDPVAAQDDT